MKPNLLRLIALLAGLAALVIGLIVMWSHDDIITDSAVAQERGTELLPMLAIFLAAVIAMAGAIFVRSKTQPLVQLIMVVGIILILALTSEALIRAKVEPQKNDSPILGPLVEVIRVNQADVPITVDGYGSVRARRQARLVPQVEGRVTAVHPNLVSGGLIPAGEILIAIDPADYEITLDRTRAEIEQARAATETAKARIEELNARLDDMTADLNRLLSLSASTTSEREIEKARIQQRIAQAQLATADSEYTAAAAQLTAANTALRRAQLDLERTNISLDFDAVVIDEQVDPGQFVTRGQSVAEVYATDAVEIPVPLEDRQLQWLESIPLVGAAGATGTDLPESKRPKATVSADFGGSVRTWQGRIARIEAQVDPRSRMVNAVVEVTNPMHLAAGAHTPLVPGMFVEVTIAGRTLRNVVPVPRHAIHDGETGDEVWVVNEAADDASHTLLISRVTVEYQDRETAYISAGIDDNALIVTSPMDAVTNGMAVRIPTADDPDDHDGKNDDDDGD